MRLKRVLRHEIGMAGQQGCPVGRPGAGGNDLTAGQMRFECGAKGLAQTGRVCQDVAGGGDLGVGQQPDFTQGGSGRIGKSCAGFIEDRACDGITGGGRLHNNGSEGTELAVGVCDTGVESGDPADPFL